MTIWRVATSVLVSFGIGVFGLFLLVFHTKSVVVISPDSVSLSGYVECSGTRRAFKRGAGTRREAKIDSFYFWGTRGDCVAVLDSPITLTTKCAYTRPNPDLYVMADLKKNRLDCWEDDD